MRGILTPRRALDALLSSLVYAALVSLYWVVRAVEFTAQRVTITGMIAIIITAMFVALAFDEGREIRPAEYERLALASGHCPSLDVAAGDALSDNVISKSEYDDLRSVMSDCRAIRAKADLKHRLQ